MRWQEREKGREKKSVLVKSSNVQYVCYLSYPQKLQSQRLRLCWWRPQRQTYLVNSNQVFVANHMSCVYASYLTAMPSLPMLLLVKERRKNKAKIGPPDAVTNLQHWAGHHCRSRSVDKRRHQRYNNLQKTVMHTTFLAPCEASREVWTSRCWMYIISGTPGCCKRRTVQRKCQKWKRTSVAYHRFHQLRDPLIMLLHRRIILAHQIRYEENDVILTLFRDHYS